MTVKSARRATATLTLDAFRSENKTTTAVCGLSLFLATLPKDEADTVRDAIRDPSIQATAIARVLKPRGFSYSHQVVARHRKASCERCGIEV